MSEFVNNDVAPGAVVQASDHNSQGSALAAVINGGLDNGNLAANAAIAGSKLADTSVTNAKTNFTAGADASGDVTLGSGVSVTDSYLTKINNLVILTGFFTKSSFSTGDTVLTLPVGYRPVAGTIRAAAFGTGGTDVGRVECSTSGAVIFRFTTARTTCVFSLVFPTA